MKNIRVYVINIDEYNEKYKPEESCEEVHRLLEEECQTLVMASEDEVSDVYTLDEFMSQFNYALENGEITSNRHYLRYFFD